MNRTDRYRRAGDIFIDAVDRPPRERTAYVESACGDDVDLRAAVWRLIHAESGAPDDAPAIGLQLLREAEVEGMTIGPYRILKVLGRGGMGVVYLGEQDAPSRRVAIKVLRRGTASPASIRRFRHEAEILGRLTHPGIAHVYDAGTHDDGEGARPYFAMELVEGRPLTESVVARGSDPRARLALFARTCDAVHHAHRQGVIHRDLKPDNILVTSEGDPKILDFGVARVIGDDRRTSLATQEGQLVGTIAYMSPEQVTGRSGEVDARSDVHALGVVLFELLTGRLPYHTEDGTMPELIRAIDAGGRTRLSAIDERLAGDLETITAKAIEREPARRYPSAAELAADIRRFMGGEPISARPATRRYRTRLFVRRHRPLVASLSALFLVLVLGIIASVQFGMTANRYLAASERGGYRLAIESAFMRQRLGDDRWARRVLAEAPEHLRDWEWNYLWARSPAVVPGPADRPLQVRSTVAFTPDGAAVAAVLMEDGVAAYDVAAGRRVAFLPVEDPGHWTLGLASDASALVAVSRRAGTVQIARLDADPDDASAASPAPTTVRLDGLSSRVRPLVGPDGDRVVVSGVDRSDLHVIHTASGDVRPITLDLTGPQLLSLDPTAGRVAALGWHDGQGELSIIDLEDGTTLATRRWSDPRALSWWRYWRPAWDPSGQRLAIHGDAATVWILDASTLDTVTTVPIELVDAVGHRSSVGCAFASPDTLFVSDRVGRIHRADLASGAVSPMMRTQRTAELAVSPGGERLLVSGLGTARLIETNTTPGCRELRGHTSYAYMHAWSPDGTLLATSAWDGTVRIWDAASGRRLRTVEVWPGAKPSALVFDGSRTLEVLCTAEGRADDPLSRARLDLATGSVQVDRPGTVAEYLPSAPAGTRFNSRGVFTSTTSGTAGDFNVVSDDGRRAARLIFDADRRNVTGIEVVDRRTADVIWRDESPMDAVVGLNHDGSRLLLGHRTGRIELIDVDADRRLVSRTVHDGAIYSAAFDPDESRVVTAGIDGAHILEGGTLAPLLHFRDADDYVRSASFSPDGTRVVTVSGDSVIRLYDAVPSADRRRDAKQDATRRAAAEAHVDELIEVHGGPGATWVHVHGLAEMPEDERRTVRAMLVHRALERIPDRLPAVDATAGSAPAAP